MPSPQPGRETNRKFQEHTPMRPATSPAHLSWSASSSSRHVLNPRPTPSGAMTLSRLRISDCRLRTLGAGFRVSNSCLSRAGLPGPGHQTCPATISQLASIRPIRDSDLMAAMICNQIFPNSSGGFESGQPETLPVIIVYIFSRVPISKKVGSLNESLCTQAVSSTAHFT